MTNCGDFLMLGYEIQRFQTTDILVTMAFKNGFLEIISLRKCSGEHCPS